MFFATNFFNCLLLKAKPTGETTGDVARGNILRVCLKAKNAAINFSRPVCYLRTHTRTQSDTNTCFVITFLSLPLEIDADRADRKVP